MHPGNADDASREPRATGARKMIASTVVRDCLYVNWLLPRCAAPPLPPPLRYEVHRLGGAEGVFASAVMFHHDCVRLKGVPLVRLSYPQLNLRFYVLDEDEMPAVLFRAVFVPAWALPASRAVSGPTSHWATLRFPQLEQDPTADDWIWKVHRGDWLEVRARRGEGRSPVAGALGSWAETVAYFRQRSRGYLEAGPRLKRIETSHPATEVWPLNAEIHHWSLLDRYLPAPEEGWSDPHSAFLCPRIGMTFETVTAREARLGRQVAATG